MLTTLFSVLPVLMFFILGYILKRHKFLSEGSSRDVKKIVSDLALPALLFQAFFSLEMESRYLLLFLLVFLCCALMIAAGRLTSRLLGISSPYWSLMMGGFEMGMLGYALFLSLYGSEHLSKIALMDLGQVLFVFFVLIPLLLHEKEGKSSIPGLLRSFVTSPVILAIFAGLIAGALRSFVEPNALTDALNEFITLLGRLTVPLIALMIGYELNLKREGIAMALKTVLVRKALLLILGLLIGRFFIRDYMGLSRIHEMALLTMFLLPPPFVVSIYMSQDDRKNLDYVNNTLSLSTVVSVVMIILSAILLG
jgi:predicted permease